MGALRPLHPVNDALAICRGSAAAPHPNSGIDQRRKLFGKTGQLAFVMVRGFRREHISILLRPLTSRSAALHGGKTLPEAPGAAM